MTNVLKLRICYVWSYATHTLSKIILNLKIKDGECEFGFLFSKLLKCKNKKSETTQMRNVGIQRYHFIDKTGFKFIMAQRYTHNYVYISHVEMKNELFMAANYKSGFLACIFYKWARICALVILLLK